MQGTTMEVKELKVAENLREKRHICCEGNIENRSSRNRDNEAHVPGRKKCKRTLKSSLPKFISKLFLLKKLLRVSQCKETATLVKHCGYTNINYRLI